MRKQTINLENDIHSGRCILCYSDPSVGKSVQSLTLPGRLLFINRESKDARGVIREGLELFGQPNREIDLVEFKKN